MSGHSFLFPHLEVIATINKHYYIAVRKLLLYCHLAPKTLTTRIHQVSNLCTRYVFSAYVKLCATSKCLHPCKITITSWEKPYPRAPLHRIDIHVMGLFLLQQHFIWRSINLRLNHITYLINWYLPDYAQRENIKKHASTILSPESYASKNHSS